MGPGNHSHDAIKGLQFRVQGLRLRAENLGLGLPTG